MIVQIKCVVTAYSCFEITNESSSLIQGRSSLSSEAKWRNAETYDNVVLFYLSYHTLILKIINLVFNYRQLYSFLCFLYLMTASSLI